jgi:hypothetical protein
MNEKFLDEIEGWLFEVVVDLATDQSDVRAADVVSGLISVAFEIDPSLKDRLQAVHDKAIKEAAILCGESAEDFRAVTPFDLPWNV